MTDAVPTSPVRSADVSVNPAVPQIETSLVFPQTSTENVQTQSAWKKICRTLSCGYLCRLPVVPLPRLTTGEDIENKKKKYLLYKFNNLNLDELVDDPSSYRKIDPYKNLKDFATIVHDVYTPSDVEILLQISSPGGVAYKFEELYSHLERLTKKGFMITAVVDDFCASGGYMIGSICTKIVCAPFAQIGSVGVICQLVNWNALGKKIGLEQKTFKTGKDKEAFPTGEEYTEEDVQRMNDRLGDTLKIFGGMVQKARKLSDEEMKEILSARVWYGEEAKARKLVDEISLSVDYFSNLSANGDIYVITAEPQKKSMFSSIFKLSSVPDVLENIFSNAQNNIFNSEVVNDNFKMLKLE